MYSIINSTRGFYSIAKLRIPSYSIVNSTTGKYCSVAFVWLVTFRNLDCQLPLSFPNRGPVSRQLRAKEWLPAQGRRILLCAVQRGREMVPWPGNKFTSYSRREERTSVCSLGCASVSRWLWEFRVGLCQRCQAACDEISVAAWTSCEMSACKSQTRTSWRSVVIVFCSTFLLFGKDVNTNCYVFNVLLN